MKTQDKNLVIHINKYTKEISNMIKKLEHEKIDDEIIEKALAFSIVQIGELCNKLSDEFKQEYSKIPYRSIIGMRNVVVHGYEKVDIDTVWNTCTNDIPCLEEMTNEIISNNDLDDNMYEIKL